MVPTVSIIVPVYNVEQYLNRCVTSLINQTYSNIEIVLVDDGSPDKSGLMCDEWALRDSRIIALHKVNGGLSDARNHGANMSHGKYITFVDSDDYVSSEYVSYLLELIEKYDADIACCELKQVFTEETLAKNLNNEKIIVLNGKDASFAMFGSLNVQLVVGCGKIIKRALVINNPFPLGRLHEDEATTYKMIYESNCVVISNLELYAYYQNEKSITHTKNGKNRLHIRKAFEEKAQYYIKRKEKRLYAKTIHFMVGYFYCWTDKQTQQFMHDFAKRYMLDLNVLLRTKLKIAFYLIARR